MCFFKRQWSLTFTSQTNGSQECSEPIAIHSAKNCHPLAPNEDDTEVIFHERDLGLELHLQADDVYLSMGGDWNHGNLDYLRVLKSHTGFRAVLFCYDTIPILLPHLTLEWVAEIFPSYFENMAHCAELIVCISENSRKDLTHYLNKIQAPIPTMSLVHLGSEINLLHEGDLATSVKTVLKKPFVLFVSTIERRKNHETLYRAYTRLIDQGITDLPQLVFVGGTGWGVDDFLNDLRLDPRTQDYITLIQDATDNDLSAMYQHCLFTLYPSLYEGWGLPLAESLSFGKFCLASQTSSMPEVGGDLLEYLDPWDVALWAQKIDWYWRHPEALKKRENLIKQLYQPYAWNDTSESILQIAQSVLHTP